MRTVSGWHGKRKSSTTRLMAFFESEEGQKEFETWKRQQDKERVEQENQLKAA